MTDETTAGAPSRDQVIKEISKTSKAALIDEIRRAGQLVWTAHPLERWSKDDLIAEVANLRGVSLW